MQIASSQPTLEGLVTYIDLTLGMGVNTYGWDYLIVRD